MTNLTVDQPAATLAALGVVTVLTFDEPTDYRGEVRIAASDTLSNPLWDPPPREWRVTVYGLEHNPDTTEKSPADKHPLRFGQVVGTATLTDVVPIVSGVAAHDAPLPSMLVRDRELWRLWRSKHGAPARLMKRWMNQLPYQDWSPTAECPDCYQGMVAVAPGHGPSGYDKCERCDGTGGVQRWAYILTNPSEEP